MLEAREADSRIAVGIERRGLRRCLCRQLLVSFRAALLPFGDFAARANYVGGNRVPSGGIIALGSRQRIFELGIVGAQSRHHLVALPQRCDPFPHLRIAQMEERDRRSARGEQERDERDLQ